VRVRHTPTFFIRLSPVGLLAGANWRIAALRHHAFEFHAIGGLQLDTHHRS
jgi:hypothetical protein